MYKSRSVLKILCCLLALLAFSGCGTKVPLAAKTQEAVSKNFKVSSPSKAGIYIYRHGGFGSGSQARRVLIDGVQLGETVDGVFFHKEVRSGEHTVSTEGAVGDNNEKFIAKGGKNYFFRVLMRPGLPFKPSSYLVHVSEDEGKENVLKCDEAVSLTPPL